MGDPFTVSVPPMADNETLVVETRSSQCRGEISAIGIWMVTPGAEPMINPPC